MAEVRAVYALVKSISFREDNTHTLGFNDFPLGDDFPADAFPPTISGAVRRLAKTLSFIDDTGVEGDSPVSPTFGGAVRRLAKTISWRDARDDACNNVQCETIKERGDSIGTDKDDYFAADAPLQSFKRKSSAASMWNDLPTVTHTSLNDATHNSFSSNDSAGSIWNELQTAEMRLNDTNDTGTRAVRELSRKSSDGSLYDDFPTKQEMRLNETARAVHSISRKSSAISMWDDFPTADEMDTRSEHRVSQVSFSADTRKSSAVSFGTFGSLVSMEGTETSRSFFSKDSSLEDEVRRIRSSFTHQKRDIKWNGVGYCVGEKEILKGCWGEVPHGNVCAILGPSGAGKSSLLNILAGRLSPDSGAKYQISGAVYVSGELIVPSEYRKNIAYVMQDDALMATATPREALLFSASMRLPQNTPQGELVALTEKLLGDLGLTECADVLIGNALIKGISGGQRKRTSVAVEIITEPSLLFLDEPTSGLDSHTASSLVVLLKDIAQRGSAVLCTIHQPSSEVFALFDRCIVMREGRIFYQGDVAAILPHFASLGCPCPTLYNPADFIMNLAQSTEGKAAERLFMPTPATDDTVSSRHESTIIRKRASFLQQYLQLSGREFLNAMRDTQSLVVRFTTTIMLNLFYGLIFINAGNADNGQTKHFNAHVGAVCILIIFSFFGSAQAVMLDFPCERPMFLREYSTGTYSVLPYMLAKMSTELPLVFAQMIVQYVVAYFLMDLQGSFIIFIAIGFLLSLTSNSFALILGAYLADVKTVTEVANLVFLPQMLFGGIFVRMSLVPIWLRWAQYLCALSYGTKLAFLNEFNSSLDSCNSSGQAKINCARLANGELVEGQSMWRVWVLCMVGICVAARTVAALILVQSAKKFS